MESLWQSFSQSIVYYAKNSTYGLE